jgi:hypothetical protein
MTRQEANNTRHSRWQRTRSVLDIALDIHMTTTGSYERSDEEQEADIAALKKRLDEWKRSDILSSRPFDDCVRHLLSVAIWEAETRRRKA